MKEIIGVVGLAALGAAAALIFGDDKGLKPLVNSSYRNLGAIATAAQVRDPLIFGGGNFVLD